MPLLGARISGEADHICIICGAERVIKANDWIEVEGDGSVLVAPPCPCGAQETLYWHDDVYHARETIYEKIGTAPHPDFPDDRKKDHPVYKTIVRVYPDHDQPMAKHMKLLEKVAQAKGKKQAKTGTKAKYDQEPVTPQKDTIRAHVARSSPSAKTKILKDHSHLKDKL